MTTIRGSAADRGEWWSLDAEPPVTVTRLLGRDGLTVVIRGTECEWCGPGHSHWAFVLGGGKPCTPSADSSREGEGGWHCWMDLDTRGPMIDDTANDNRERPA